jgi:hypothetical protein
MTSFFDKDRALRNARTAWARAFVIASATALALAAPRIAAQDGADHEPLTGRRVQPRPGRVFLQTDARTGEAHYRPVGLAAGNVFRVFVEPGAGRGQAGVALVSGTPDEPEAQELRVLVGRPGARSGLGVYDRHGDCLWEDAYVRIPWYTPLLLEVVSEPERLRVQLFHWDGQTLLAQSEWIQAPPVPDAEFVCVTRGQTTAFLDWQRDNTPLSPIVPNSPTRMRVSSDPDTWQVVGDGDWRWTSVVRDRIRQHTPAERTSLIHAVPEPMLGLRRCRVRVDPGTGGAGMLVGCNTAADNGFIVWLGGTPGNGGLMLYRLPLDSLWSSEQGKWQYDREYVLESEVTESNIRIRLFAADDMTLLAESPAFALTDEESGRTACCGVQTWRGTAEFADFQERADAGRQERSAAEPSPPDDDTVRGIRVVSGDWQSPSPATFTRTDERGVGAAVVSDRTASKGLYRGRVSYSKAGGTVEFLFQVDPELEQGFACRLGAEGVTVVTMDGRTLWSDLDFACPPDTVFTVEGVVMTDRVQARVLDADGALLAESVPLYVSDRNNSRQGSVGIRCTDTRATLADWTITPEE